MYVGHPSTETNGKNTIKIITEKYVRLYNSFFLINEILLKKAVHFFSILEVGMKSVP